MADVSVWLEATVGWTFLLGGLVKLRRPGLFRRALGGYHIFRGRPRAEMIASWSIPPLELAVGVLLSLGIIRGLASLALGMPLLATFSYAVHENAKRRITSPCGCGLFGGRTGYTAVLRNALLAAMLVLGALGSEWSTLGRIAMPMGKWFAVESLALASAILAMSIPTVLDEVQHQLEHVS